ncbi:hypothetical protein [Flavobacterium sp. U410]
MKKSILFQEKIDNHQKKSIVPHIFIFLFFGMLIFSMILDSSNKKNETIAFGILGIVLIAIFFIYTQINYCKLMNSAIKEMSIIDDRILIKTFSIKLFSLYTFKEIEVILNFKVTKIVKVDFPMKGFDEFKGNCFKIVGVKGEEFDIEKNIFFGSYL